MHGIYRSLILGALRVFARFTYLDKSSFSKNQEFRISQFLNGQIKNLELYDNLINLLPEGQLKSSKSTPVKKLKIGPNEFNNEMGQRFKEFSLTHQGFSHFLIVKFVLVEVHRRNGGFGPLVYSRELNGANTRIEVVLEFLKYVDQKESSIIYSSGYKQVGDRSTLNNLESSGKVDPFGQKGDSFG